MTALFRILAIMAARWRMPRLLRVIGMLRPQALVGRDPCRGPLIESVCGGSMGCLLVVMENWHTHDERAIWAAAGQCFYSEEWEMLAYFVRHSGERVLHDHTITAWWHLAAATEHPRPERETWLAALQRSEPASLALWLAQRGLAD